MTKAEKVKLIEFRDVLSDLLEHSDFICDEYLEDTFSHRFYEGKLEAFYDSIKAFDNLLADIGISPYPRQIVPIEFDFICEAGSDDLPY